MIQIRQVKLPVDHEDAALEAAVLKALRIPAGELESFEVFRRSADARKKDTQGVVFIYTLNATVRDEAAVLGRNRNPNVVPAPDTTYQMPPLAETPADRSRPVIIGTGPCGLFAGLLLAMRGRPPLLIERGKMAGPRARDVTRFWRGESDVDPDSNVQYGEGGAGTFSDGKLYTGIKDRQHRIRWILNQLAEHGAPADILTDAKPHIGTDRLIKVVRNLREKIISKPSVILDDQDVMRALIAANEKSMGGNIVDLRGIAMERLESRLDRLEDTGGLVAVPVTGRSKHNLAVRVPDLLRQGCHPLPEGVIRELAVAGAPVFRFRTDVTAHLVGVVQVGHGLSRGVHDWQDKLSSNALPPVIL